MKLLPLEVVACVPPSEQLAMRGGNRLHESISKRLHDHLFINIISYLPFDSHQTCLRLHVRPSANV
jgi:hypothetical protein